MRTSIFLILLLMLYYMAAYVENTFPNEEYMSLEGGFSSLLLIFFVVCMVTDIAEMIQRLRGTK